MSNVAPPLQLAVKSQDTVISSVSIFTDGVPHSAKKGPSMITVA
jgi:hypothetical protein